MIRKLACAALLVLAASASAHAYTLKTLHDFCDPDCTDGSGPIANLVGDGNGAFYGVTLNDGEQFGGTVYALTPGKSGKLKKSTVYNFCTNTNCDGGYAPAASLIIDTAGDLYGTTSQGDDNLGTAFELIPNKHKTIWTIKVLYAFCSGGPEDCPDGSRPVSNLTYAGAASGAPYDGISPLYGTTSGGGDSDKGTVYSLTRKGATWTHTILYSFCALANCADGAVPSGTLTADAPSNIYGTTQSGDAGGVVFEISGAQHGGRAVTETVLHDFCPEEFDCPDGAGPDSVTFDTEGNMFGITQLRGNSNNGGTVFELVPNGTNSTLTTLYSFCRTISCKDGMQPVAIAIDGSGNLFGTTEGGGKNSGTVFELAPRQGTYRFSQLYKFCSKSDCSDGSLPRGGVLVETSGALMGTTYEGGNGMNGGTVFELTP
jgi:uncharacterized repeat protein (TIGR03803 family)